MNKIRTDYTLTSNQPETNMNRTAYDYTAQKWIQGPEALQLLRQQCRETLDLLEAPDGARYAKFVGRDHAEFLAETLAHARTLD